MSFRLALCCLTALLLASCASLPPAIPVVAREKAAAPPISNNRLGQITSWWGDGRAPTVLVNAGFVAIAPATGGLDIRDFSGTTEQRLPAGSLGYIDVATLPLENSYAVVVGGTERSSGRTRIVLFRLDSSDDQPMRRWGEIATDLSDPRGFCMRQIAPGISVVVFDRRGEARHFTVTQGPDGGLVSGEISRFRINRPGTGCAIVTGESHLYVGHASRGFWRYSLNPQVSGPPRLMGQSGPPVIPRSASVSVLSTLPHTYLASLDHDRAAISLWRIERDDLRWLGRVEVREGPGGPRVHSLGSLDAYGGELEGFPGGVIVVHGRVGGAPPSLKFVDWSAVQNALGLEIRSRTRPVQSDLAPVPVVPNP
jgi:3-phytase